MLHDMQCILGIGIEGSLPAEPADGEWKLALAGLFGEPMSELRRKGYFTSGSINVGEVMKEGFPSFGDAVYSLLHGYCRLNTAGG